MRFHTNRQRVLSDNSIGFASTLFLGASRLVMHNTRRGSGASKAQSGTVTEGKEKLAGRILERYNPRAGARDR